MAHALVLGVGGFLGSHLARHLLDRGWAVTGVLRSAEDPSVEPRLGRILADLRIVEGDAGDADLLAGQVISADAVFTLAGHSGAARSMAQPLDDLTSNAIPQLALLEVLRRWNPEARVVFPGSRLQYGRPRRLPVTEEHPQEPTSLYGIHKALAEQYHLLYHRTYGLAVTSLRIPNPYGPHQNRADRAFGVVGNFLATAASGGRIELWGGGPQLREYVYVDDLCRLFVLAATSPAAVGRVYNVASSAPTSLRAMAGSVVETVGTGSVVEVPWPSAEAAVETGDYVADGTRAREELGWKPKVELAEGLRQTWDALEPVLARPA
jgi:UDP-glucose 4-epimerase